MKDPLGFLDSSINFFHVWLSFLFFWSHLTNIMNLVQIKFKNLSDKNFSFPLSSYHHDLHYHHQNCLQVPDVITE